MTDNEIIQALEYCFTNDFGKTNCNKCAFYTATAKCMDDMQNAVIDLINRQREEIERLQKGNKLLSENADTAFQDGLNEAQELYALQVEGEIKSEAIKDFSERLKENYCFTDRWGKIIPISTIDDLVKEITEGKK